MRKGPRTPKHMLADPKGSADHRLGNNALSSPEADSPGPSDSENTTKDNFLIQQSASDKQLPEGFFDDPILDAKARNIEYKNPIEEEWEKFQKEIREEASASAEIIAEEQEEATAERQIDEIDEQMRNWSRVLELELKKEEAQKIKNENCSMDEREDNETDNEADIDEFLDWRAKKAYR
ncbi:Zinc finger protein 830 [Eumeta japonica]|uniref:Zinc finger protein 830 n=1 Tax=Eumeta variegata TaxID=151549 RepID=A0A4C1WEL0_EUMVA|nr:Zinc finger protein 830 [Eumeta japonica]